MARHRAPERHRWVHRLLLLAGILLLLAGVIELGGFAWLERLV